jgi:hypothetical protein
MGDLILAKLSVLQIKTQWIINCHFSFHPFFLGSQDQKKKVSGLGEVHKDIHIWLEIDYNACMEKSGAHLCKSAKVLVELQKQLNLMIIS